MKTPAQLFPFSQGLAPQMQDGAWGFILPDAKTAWRSRISVSREFRRKNSAALVPRSTEPASIYVVDDNEGLMEVYVILLEGKGYRVRPFQDRSEALAALQEDRNDPKLLIMDYLGHAMPADRFIRRCLLLHPALRILMASGLGLGDVRLSGARPDSFIQKPFTAEEFLEEVKAVLAPRHFAAFFSS